MADQPVVGYLLPMKQGYFVACPECKDKFPQFAGANTPVFVENLGQYRQPCCYCNKELNPNANRFWPVLFDGK